MTKKDWEKEFEEKFGHYLEAKNYRIAKEKGHIRELDEPLLWGKMKDAKKFINFLLAKQKKESEARGYVEGLCANKKIHEPGIKKEIIEKMKEIVKKSKPTFFIGKGMTDEIEQAMDDAIYETKAQIYEDLFEKDLIKSIKEKGK